MNKKKIKNKIEKIKSWYSKSKIVSIIQSFIILISKIFKFILYNLYYHWKWAVLLLFILVMYFINKNENIIFTISNNGFIKFLTLYNFHKNLQISQYSLEIAISILLVFVLIFSFRLKDLKLNKISKIQNIIFIK